MAQRTRRLKKVSFTSRGRKVMFYAKRGAAAAYRKGKPHAVKGAKAAYRHSRQAALYGRAKAIAHNQKGKSQRGRPISTGAYVYHPRHGKGLVLYTKYSKTLGGGSKVAIVKFKSNKENLVIRTQDLKRSRA